MKLGKLFNKLPLIAAALSLACPGFAANTQPTPILKTNIQAPDQYPLGEAFYNKYRWSALYYYGHTVNAALFGVFVGNAKYWPEYIESVEGSYTLDPDNFLRRLVYPLVSVTQFALNGTVRHGHNQHTIYEINPYLSFRWANWPWNKYLPTSLAIGEGISYDSSISALERRSNENTKRLLNYLMLEATFALPNHPQLQLVARIHHRSGMFGVYHAGNTGSNVIGGGIRYLF